MATTSGPVTEKANSAAKDRKSRGRFTEVYEKAKQRQLDDAQKYLNAVRDADNDDDALGRIVALRTGTVLDVLVVAGVGVGAYMFGIMTQTFIGGTLGKRVPMVPTIGALIGVAGGMALRAPVEYRIGLATAGLAFGFGGACVTLPMSFRNGSAVK